MNTEKQYIQAFNNGYILAQYEPDFSNILSETLTPANNYLQGFLAGNAQLEFENSNHQIFELQQLRNRTQIKEKGLGRDK